MCDLLIMISSLRNNWLPNRSDLWSSITVHHIRHLWDSAVWWYNRHLYCQILWLYVRDPHSKIRSHTSLWLFQNHCVARMWLFLNCALNTDLVKLSYSHVDYLSRNSDIITMMSFVFSHYRTCSSHHCPTTAGGPVQVKHWSWTQLTLTSWHAPYNPTGTRARAHQQTALATLCSPQLFVRLNLDLSNSCSSLPPWTYGNIASARGHVFYLGQVPMSSLLG